MSVIYCQRCDNYIDTDYDVEHCEHMKLDPECDHCLDDMDEDTTDEEIV